MFEQQKTEFLRLLDLENQQNSRNIVVNEILAMTLGLNVAIIVESLHGFLKDPVININGYDWITKSFDDWHKEKLKFWSLSTVRRSFQEAKAMNVVFIEKMKIHNRQCVCFTLNYPLITLKVKNYLKEMTLLGQNGLNQDSHGLLEPSFNNSQPFFLGNSSQIDSIVNEDMAEIIAERLNDFSAQAVAQTANEQGVSTREAVVFMLKSLLTDDQAAQMDSSMDSVISEWINEQIDNKPAQSFTDLSANDVDRFFTTDNLGNFASLKTVIDGFEAYKTKQDDKKINTGKSDEVFNDGLGMAESAPMSKLASGPSKQPNPKKVKSLVKKLASKLNDEEQTTDLQKRQVFIKQLMALKLARA